MTPMTSAWSNSCTIICVRSCEGMFHGSHSEPMRLQKCNRSGRRDLYSTLASPASSVAIPACWCPNSLGICPSALADRPGQVCLATAAKTTRKKKLTNVGVTNRPTQKLPYTTTRPLHATPHSSPWSTNFANVLDERWPELRCVSSSIPSPASACHCQAGFRT